jgi:hypothetical protein
VIAFFSYRRESDYSVVEYSDVDALGFVAEEPAVWN